VQEKPKLRKTSRFLSNADLEAMGSIGFGTVSVRGLNRFPKPPANITESNFVFS
jgi:hypothetical protein